MQGSSWTDGCLKLYKKSDSKSEKAGNVPTPEFHFTTVPASKRYSAWKEGYEKIISHADLQKVKEYLSIIKMYVCFNDSNITSWYKFATNNTKYEMFDIKDTEYKH